MSLVAKSGTPLFISGEQEAIGQEQKKLIKESSKTASQHLPIAEPIDWLKTLCQKNGN